ncbi:unnamed protein product [Symbiodinium sp. KB8]|nr:unnamed protein product [Symbiodinium sp. KB8]
MQSASVLRALSAPVWRIYQLRWSSSTWQVSSYGRVRNSRGAISLGTNFSGYRRVNIQKTFYLVHRLVAAAFIGAPPDPSRWQVNHLDGDPSNNNVTNLQYASNSENVRHSWVTNASRKSTGMPILWRPFGEASTYCASQREAYRLLGVRPSSVFACCSGSMAKVCGNGRSYELRRLQLQSMPEELWRAAIYPCEREAVPNLVVSNHGRVSPIKGQEPRGISFGYHMRDGYHAVTRAGRKFLVHRLVAGTFLGEPPSPGMQVNHKDSDRGNNHVDNLEYVTAAQNTQHAHAQRMKLGITEPSRNGKAVQARIKGCKGSWLDFTSIKSASSATGIAADYISRACADVQIEGVEPGEWEFRLRDFESLPGEEWLPVVLDLARAPQNSKRSPHTGIEPWRSNILQSLLQTKWSNNKV